MEKILLISHSTALENRLADLVDSPRLVARVSSWAEARRLLTKTVPATVLVGSELISDPSAGQALVHLNDVLQKDQKSAYLLAEPDDDHCRQWLDMFESIDDVIAPPSSLQQWVSLRDLLTAHLEPSSDDDSASTSSAADAQPTGDGPTEVVIRLPRITSGSLSSLSISRIMYCLHHHQATGLLHLSSSAVERSFAFRDGAFIDDQHHGDERTLTGAYAWSDGDFEFVARDHLSGDSIPIYSVIKKGLITHRSQRQLMNGLMSRMDSYPTRSHLWDQRRDTIDWDILRRFLAYCDGQRDLESIFSDMGRHVTEAFCAAAFCRDTDLVVFRAQPTAGPLHIQYDATASSASPDDSESADTSASSSAPAGDADELAARFETMKRQSPHEIFDVWKGCGREVVKETYYSMVKTHHPDVYGGNVDADVRSYAQKIFVQIRDAYTQLLQIEDEQTTPPPDQPPASESEQKPGGRRKLTTLHPGQTQGQSDPSASRTPNRKKSSTPIAMGRTPTSVHPDLEQQLGDGDADASPHRSTSNPGKDSNTNKERSPTPPPSMSSRPSSSEGLGDATSDPEWRREQLERLQKKRRKPARRATPISTTKKSSSSSDDPARDAFNIGYKKFKSHHYDDALSYLKKAHNLDPDHGLYTVFFAYCLFQADADKANEARKLLKEVIRKQDRQSLPDAHLFMGHILKADKKEHRAYKHFKKALSLNPASRDAEREIRLYERRHGKGKDSKSSASGGFFKKLFKD